MIKGLVFDFDGLILDTESAELIIWQEIFASYHRELKLEQWIDSVGKPQHHFDPYLLLEEAVGSPIDPEAVKRQRQLRSQELNGNKPALPGVNDYVASAKQMGLGLAVASSSDRKWVQGHLERLGLFAHFDSIVCAEDTEAHKPNPAPFLTAVKRLGCTPDEAIAFEDSANGVAAAKAAGLVCIAIPNSVTRHQDLDAADLILDSLATLPLPRLMKTIATMTSIEHAS